MFENHLKVQIKRKLKEFRKIRLKERNDYYYSLAIFFIFYFTLSLTLSNIDSIIIKIASTFFIFIILMIIVETKSPSEIVYLLKLKKKYKNNKFVKLKHEEALSYYFGHYSFTSIPFIAYLLGSFMLIYSFGFIE